MPTSGVLSFMSNIRVFVSGTCSPIAYLSKIDNAGRGNLLVPLCTLLGLWLAFPKQVKADFVGYYALPNFTLTNTNNGAFPSYTNGSAITPDGGQSVVLTGGDGGSGLYGATDLFITAATSGTVQFDWSYFSSDPSSSGTFPNGCGAGFIGPCDDAGYLLGGNFVQLADDIHQGTGLALVTFPVTAGETFGFRVETMDNFGGPGVLTISAFSAPAPVPEPSNCCALFLLTAGIIAAQRSIVSLNRKKENAG